MYFLLIIKIFFFFFFALILLTSKNNNIPIIINEPIIPINDELNVKKYHISKFNLSHPRYNFQEKYNKRKVYKINYSYYPYLNISKKKSYKDNAIYLFNSTGMLNITKFEYFYKKKNIKINILKLNQIHLAMAFDKNYSDLALISIASVLNTSNSDTYIHFHILGINFGFNEIKKIIDLRKINNKVEFIFYNAKQVEYDFDRAKKERRGFGNYAKILCPQIVNNTNKILILDSGDIISQKDLSEVYFYDIGDNYFGWMLEICAGYYLKYEDKFMTYNFHPNAGVFLVNIRLFRKDELYKKAVFLGKSYHSFECPVQEILLTITNYKFKYIPLNYNVNLYYEHEEDKLLKRNISSIKTWLRVQRFSPHKYTFNEIVDAMSDPVIHHFYIGKMQHQSRCNKYVFQCLKYVKLAGIYEKIKLKYPKPFTCEKFLD